MDPQPERKFYLKHFKAISHALSNYEDLNLLINHIAEGITRTFDVKGCCIMLLDERENQLFTVSSHGISDSYLSKGPIFVDDKYTSLVIGKPIYVENMQNDPRIQYPEAAVRENIVTMYSFPIKCREATIGVMRLYHSARLVLHEDDIDSLSVLTQHLGLVIENNGLKNFLGEVHMAMQRLPLRLLQGPH
jgi:signal transduction protein with GAF and PtsI domain